MARCCRPRLLLCTALAAVGLYGWYGLLLDLFTPEPSEPSSTGALAPSLPMETHLLSDAEALETRGESDGGEGAAANADRKARQPLASLEESEWRGCGESLLGGPARRQYGAAAALTAAEAADVELIFSLVTNSRPHAVRRAVENLLAFSTARSWVAVHLGKEPAVPYDKRDPDYRWLLAQPRVQINSVRLRTTAGHGSELWAHMHNYRLVREQQQQQQRRRRLDSFFVFASELQTVLRPGGILSLTLWLSASLCL